MRLTDFENEEALELLENILDPATKIFNDEKIKKVARDKNKNRLVLAKEVIANHKKEIIEILAAMEGKKVAEFKTNVLLITKQLLEILNDPVMNDFFSSLADTEGEKSSMPPTENTKETGKM